MIHKAIKGYEDYLITDTGRVYSLKSQKYLSLNKRANGYLQVDLCKNGKIKHSLIHRLVAEAFIEKPEGMNEVDHINRVRDDNRVENLRWANRKIQFENMDHSERIKVCKLKRGTPIIEVINDDISIGYLSLSEVPNIYHNPIRRHIIKGETDFVIKQRNGSVRHFKLPKED